MSPTYKEERIYAECLCIASFLFSFSFLFTVRAQARGRTRTFVRACVHPSSFLGSLEPLLVAQLSQLHCTNGFFANKEKKRFIYWTRLSLYLSLLALQLLET